MAKQKQRPENNPEANMEEKILAAAEELFFRQGYAETSTTQIAKEVGCNQALVHYYFRTKEKLFNAVLGGKVKDVFRQFISMESSGRNFEEKLKSLIEIHYDTIRENAVMVPFLLTEISRNPDIFDDIISSLGEMPGQTLEMFRQDLEKEIERGRIRPVTLMELVLNIVSLNVFLFAAKPVFAKLWGYSNENLDELLDQRKKQIVDTILLSLRP